MAIDYFGAGVLFATPSYDGSGNAIAIASPVQFGIVQDVTIEDSAENKELYGALQYPVDIGRGKSKLAIKVKQAFVNAELFNSVYFGQTLTASYDALYGALQYPVDIGRGKSKLAIKVKQAFVNAELFNSVYFGQTLTASYDALY